jgi:hypothetical protein
MVEVDSASSGETQPGPIPVEVVEAEQGNLLSQALLQAVS